MLVLSRRPTEKILFPCIGTAVEVVSIKGRTVRLAIDAPPEVIVLRDELRDRAAEWAGPAALPEPSESQLRELRHLVRNQLNVATLGLALLRKQVQAGLSGDLEETIVTIERKINMFQKRLDGEVAKPRSVPPKPTRKTRKALLVEDDENERELLAGFLRMSGFAVDTAGDGCDALDYLRTGERPDVVLLDMGLPRCDGPTTAREIRRDPAYSGLRIIAVTGHSPDEFNLPGGPGGIDRWFSKPLDPVALLRELTPELNPV
jgi:carbon storage regulator CsrA